ncbi:MAG: hypothetical protein DME59_17125, partial [Verrucomicrobia bacterium]
LTYSNSPTAEPNANFDADSNCHRHIYSNATGPEPNTDTYIDAHPNAGASVHCAGTTTDQCRWVKCVYGQARSRADEV